MSQALANLRAIGTVAEMMAAASHARPRVLANNAHLHLPPNFSAFTSVQQAMDLANAQDCRIIGASNYYDYHVYSEFSQVARQKNIFPLFGMEIICLIDDLRDAGIKINDPGNPGKMYICGKGIVKFAERSPEAERILLRIRSADAARIATMVERLSAMLNAAGIANSLTADTVIDMVVHTRGVARDTVCLQERHVAQCLQEHIFAQVPADQRLGKLTTLFGGNGTPKMKSPEDFIGLQNELRSRLMKAGRPGYVEETFIDFAPALQLIAELGGFASYPILADGNNPVCPFEDPVAGLITSLRQRRIHAVELITGRNSLAVVSAYARACRASGLIVTAGTEHNTPEMIPLAPVCLQSETVPAELQVIFYEGVCVIAAHQFLVAHDRMGYTDAHGNLNPDYADAESRIIAFAKLGDTVIRKYLKLTGP